VLGSEQDVYELIHDDPPIMSERTVHGTSFVKAGVGDIYPTSLFRTKVELVSEPCLHHCITKISPFGLDVIYFIDALCRVLGNDMDIKTNQRGIL
jgi:hypothetical protein